MGTRSRWIFPDRAWDDEGQTGYVPAAERREQAREKVRRLREDGQALEPVQLTGNAIATTFWGKAWCRNLEAYSDFANRLPRGRSYLRNGQVVDLRIDVGLVRGRVSGTELYDVEVAIAPVPPARWKELAQKVRGRVDSVVALLEGRMPPEIIGEFSRREAGLFPSPEEIRMRCSCPDGARMCKHVAAVMYAIGTRLDTRPELLFSLRQVDHGDLVATAAGVPAPVVGPDEELLSGADLAGIFGIELAGSAAGTLPEPPAAKPPGSPRKRADRGATGRNPGTRGAR